MRVFYIVVAAFLLSFSSLATNSTNATIPCSNINCNHGSCNNATNTCTCDRGYLTATGQPPCSYQQKSSVTAGVLEFIFPGFGFGQMYLQNWGLGFGKFAINLVIATLITIPIIATYNKGKLGAALRGWDSPCLGIMWAGALIIFPTAQIAWWLHDGIVIVQGENVGIVGQPSTWHYEPYRDGNGYFIDGCTACR